MGFNQFGWANCGLRTRPKWRLKCPGQGDERSRVATTFGAEQEAENECCAGKLKEVNNYRPARAKLS